jgi:hypothetical protein
VIPLRGSTLSHKTVCFAKSRMHARRSRALDLGVHERVEKTVLAICSAEAVNDMGS